MGLLKLHLVTGNKNKLAEIESILSGVVDLTNHPLNLVEIQGTIEEIIRDKAIRAATEINGPVLVEDTCLCFNALKGLPGPYIKWFLEILGLDGLNRLLAGHDDKSAEAVCTFAFCSQPGQEPIIFQGRTLGNIVPARSKPGAIPFGWDAIFEHRGQTYAEMDKVEKNKISHRYKALAKLKDWLSTYSQKQDPQGS